MISLKGALVLLLPALAWFGMDHNDKKECDTMSEKYVSSDDQEQADRLTVVFTDDQAQQLSKLLYEFYIGKLYNDVWMNAYSESMRFVQENTSKEDRRALDDAARASAKDIADSERADLQTAAKEFVDSFMEYAIEKMA
jgi:hypothetical protein